MFSLGKVSLWVGISLLLSIPSATTLQAQSAGFVYITNHGGNSGPTAGSISAFSIESKTGALQPVPGSPFPDPHGPWSITVDPKGRFAFVANRANDSISAYSIDGATGVLTSVPGSPFLQDPSASGELPVSVAVDPEGRFLFVADYNFSTVRAYQINQETGALTQAPGSPFEAGINPESLTVDLTGHFVYVAIGYHNGNGYVSAYSIDRNTGSLKPVPGSPFPVPVKPWKSGQPPPGSEPVSVVTHSTSAGRVLYVADGYQAEILQYFINENTGALTLTPDSPVSVPGGPYYLAEDPHSHFLFASNQYPSYPNGSVASYSIEPSNGSLTAVHGSPFSGGPVPVAAAFSPQGRFLFTANQGSYQTNYSGSVSAYIVNGNTGALTPVPGSPFPTGPLSTSVAVAPDPTSLQHGHHPLPSPDSSNQLK